MSFSEDQDSASVISHRLNVVFSSAEIQLEVVDSGRSKKESRRFLIRQPWRRELGSMRKSERVVFRSEPE